MSISNTFTAAALLDPDQVDSPSLSALLFEKGTTAIEVVQGVSDELRPLTIETQTTTTLGSPTVSADQQNLSQSASPQPPTTGSFSSTLHVEEPVGFKCLIYI